jgi:multidrug efflux pump subunit AcrB
MVLTIIGLGLASRLSLRLNPSKTPPSIRVDYSWPGASSKSVEQQITATLEGGFSTLRNIEKISSRSSKSIGYVQISFDKYADIDIARFEVATVIRQLYKSFPVNCSYPVISVNRPDDDQQGVFLSYSVNAPRSRLEIQETVSARIVPQIGSLSGIDQVNVNGANPLEFLISFNNDKLRALNIGKQQLVFAVDRLFERVSIGKVHQSMLEFNVVVKPGPQQLQWHIPLTEVGGKIVYLDEISQIRKQEQEARSYYRVNGKNAITIGLNATKDANTIALAKEVVLLLDEIQKTLPSDYTIVKDYDSTTYLQEELSKIYKRSIYTLIILLLFIGLVSLSLRYLFTVVICLVANICIAFVFYYLFRVEIQLYSLAGITISLGIIIDNIIVMTDHLRMQGNKKIIIPILASTLTTMGALSVINFLDDEYKLNLIDFAKVISINLGVSLVIAFYMVPAILKRIAYKTKQKNVAIERFSVWFYPKYANLLRFLLGYKKVAIILLILIFGVPFFMLPKQLESNQTWYQKAYNNTLGNEWYLEHIRPSVDKYLGGSFRLFSYFVYENAFYSRNEETKLYVIGSMEKGATVHQMNEVFLGLENYLSPMVEVDRYVTNVYSGDYARMEITFKEDFVNTAFPNQLKARLIRKALDFGGLEWSIYGVGQGFNNSNAVGAINNYSVQARGYNYEKLSELALQLKEALEAHPRIQEAQITDNSDFSRKSGYEYQFSLDKQALALQGSSPQRFMRQLQDVSLQKNTDLNLTLAGQNYPLRFESTRADDFDLWNIKNNPMDSLDFPKRFANVGTVVKVKEQENIDKENQEYLRKIKFQYTGAAKFGSRFLSKTLDSINPTLPIGFTFERSQRSLSFFKTEETSQYTWLLLLVIAIIYLLCATLFESFTQPFIILSVIPISFIGVFLTFYWFDYNFDQGGLASFVLLSGLTVNASIFIINDFNFLRKTGIDGLSAYIKAFRQKIFPISLTIISTILGFIPFVADGQNEVFWFALGAGTIGGLLFSFVGILIYLPLFSLRRARKFDDAF